MADFGKLNFSTSFKPTSAFPLDARLYFTSLDLATAAAETAEEVGSKNSIYHYGMKLLVDNGTTTKWYTIQRDRTLVEDGSVKCVVGIEPVDMNPEFLVTYSDGTEDQIALSDVPVHTHIAQSIIGGRFGGKVCARSDSQSPEEYLLRNIKVGLTTEDPENEGELFFKCK